MQINVFAATRAAANATAQAIEDGLRTSPALQARPNAQPMCDYDADMLVYSTIQDFSIWAAR